MIAAVLVLFAAMSAVEGGRLAAASIVARLHGDPAFRRDLDAARRELGASE